MQGEGQGLPVQAQEHEDERERQGGADQAVQGRAASARRGDRGAGLGRGRDREGPAHHHPQAQGAQACDALPAAGRLEARRLRLTPASAVAILRHRDAAVAQLARASACHAEGRGFESLQPLLEKPRKSGAFRVSTPPTHWFLRTGGPASRPRSRQAVDSHGAAERTA